MNKQERAKARALLSVKTRAPGQRQFIRQTAWLGEHDGASTPLSAAQKWYLDFLVWRFRRQLAGCDGFEMPEEEPRREDYIQAHEERCEKRRADLEAIHGRKPQQGEIF